MPARRIRPTRKAKPMSKRKADGIRQIAEELAPELETQEATEMPRKKGEKKDTAPATGPDPSTMNKTQMLKSIPGWETMANKEVIEAVRQTYGRDITSANVAAARQKRKGKASPGKRTRQTAPASNNGRPSLQTEVRQDAASDFLASLDALKQLRDRIGGDGIRKALELMGD